MEKLCFSSQFSATHPLLVGEQIIFTRDIFVLSLLLAGILCTTKSFSGLLQRNGRIKYFFSEHPVASNMQGLSKEFSRNLKERAQGVCNEHTSKVQNCARNLQRRCMKYPKNIEEML